MVQLPNDIWMKVFTYVAEGQRIEWWNNLHQIQQEYKEWPMYDQELAEYMFNDVFKV